MMRNQMAMAPQILAQGQQRLQGVPAQFEPRFMERFVPLSIPEPIGSLTCTSALIVTLLKEGNG